MQRDLASSERLRIVVLGYVVRFPFGGMTWHYLNYVLGLLQLGHEVYFLEDSDDYDQCCYDPQRCVNSSDPSYGLAYATALFNRVPVGERWAYYDAHRQTWLGPLAERAEAMLAGADVLINVSGSNPLRDWHMRVPVRVMIDTDPAFEQVRQRTVPVRRELTLKHTHHFTFGSRVAEGTAEVPEDGLCWQFTRQPIALDSWPFREASRNALYTTVMQWDSYPTREFNGRQYGMKSRSFEPFFDLPRRAGPVFQLAVSGPKTPRGALRDRGWSLVAAQEVTLDPWRYQDFIGTSHGEFGLAKHGYVAGKTGWFSERSACYLASGKPVLHQDTGFPEWLPTGSGVLAFRTAEDAVDAVHQVNRRYEHHCRAARELAVEYFDASKVLPSLLERVTTT